MAETMTLADRIPLPKDGRMVLDVAADPPRARCRGDPLAAAIEGRILDRLLRR